MKTTVLIISACLLLCVETPAQNILRDNISLSRQKINSKGEFNGLVILVEFSDTKFSAENPKERFSNMLNRHGYDTDGAKGSVRDYFIENSDSLFLPSFDVTGPVTLSRPTAYYGNNDENGEDEHASEIVVEACRMVENEINFALYDSNNDNAVDMVYIFYAGYSESENREHPEYIWAHAGNAADTSIVIGGKTIGRYACSPEYSGSVRKGGQFAAIGPVCHELGHLLGLPDFYNTLSGTGITPGAFSIMDKGIYLDGGRCPAGYSAFEREFLRWLDVPQLNDTSGICVAPLNSGKTGNREYRAFKITLPGTEEAFYFENRQQGGWDTFLPCHGMFIYHVDMNDKAAWDKNEVNVNRLHPNYRLIRSGGEYAGDSEAAFPGREGITRLNGEEYAELRSWSNVPVKFTIDSIRCEEKKIYLHFTP